MQTQPTHVDPPEPTLRFIFEGSAKVSDAKGVPADVPGTYVALKIGKNEFRTTTKWAETEPYWAETFKLYVVSLSLVYDTLSTFSCCR